MTSTVAGYAADLGSAIFRGIAGLLGAGASGYDYTNGNLDLNSTTGEQIRGRRAAGGPVSAGSTYLVGERGPELLRMGAQGGHVVPNDAMGGMTVVISPTIHAGVTRNEMQNGMNIAAQAAVRQVAESRRRGNPAFISRTR